MLLRYRRPIPSASKLIAYSSLAFHPLSSPIYLSGARQPVLKEGTFKGRGCDGRGR